MPLQASNNTIPWGKSQAKAILRRGLLNGMITTAMTPEEVRALDPEEHGKWPWRNWKTNFESLKEAIGRDRERMAKDARDYDRDKAIVMRLKEGAPPPWHKTQCPKLLKADIDSGFLHNPEKGPVDLYETREEYKAFSLEVFRNHIYQEIDSRPKREMRFERKKNSWKYPELHSMHPRLKKDDI